MVRHWAVLFLSLLVAACAGVPATSPPEASFDDRLFRPPSERVDAHDVFALSPAMKDFVRGEMAGPLSLRGRKGLVDALLAKGRLRLEYDAAITRNAAQAFDARAGNCLSLVIMTAAIAKELGLPVRYQDVIVEETWSRSGDVYMSIGHVNLSLAPRLASDHVAGVERDLLTIDFLPPEEAATLHRRAIGEQTIVAMYMNNRAVESITRDRIDDAYWWAREAIRQDPRFLSAYNTLGVVYWRHGNAALAARVFTQVLEREPANVNAMSNLVPVLRDLGRESDADRVAEKLARIEPHPPFAYFKRGLAAMEAGDFGTAKQLFAKEVERAAYYHEFHFWLAIACLQLGELAEAREHLAIAIETSATRDEHDLYAAKLSRIAAASRFR